MTLPPFFAQAPRIVVHDALAEFLGSAKDGLIEYSYADVVRLAGHSCPTVAGAYLMARAALRTLYPDRLAERGEILVSLSGGETEGTTGVIAQVFTLLTGAAGNGGFQGIGGRFVRRGLLRFGAQDSQGIASFSRRDNGATVDVSMDLSTVPPASDLREHMIRALAPDATDTDRNKFAAQWQERVQRLLLEHADDAAVILVSKRA